jgi:hypothetical protein
MKINILLNAIGLSCISLFLVEPLQAQTTNAPTKRIVIERIATTRDTKTKPYVQSVNFDLQISQSKELVQVPKGVTLTDIVGYPVSGGCLLSIQGKKSEIGDAGDFRIGAVAGTILSLHSGIPSNGGLHIAALATYGPCQGTILFTGYRQ